MLRLNINNKLNEQQHGILNAFIGFLLLLYVLNFFQFWLNMVMFLIAVGMIIYGLHEAGLFNIIAGKKKSNNHHRK